MFSLRETPFRAVCNVAMVCPVAGLWKWEMQHRLEVKMSEAPFERVKQKGLQLCKTKEEASNVQWGGEVVVAQGVHKTNVQTVRGGKSSAKSVAVVYCEWIVCA